MFSDVREKCTGDNGFDTRYMQSFYHGLQYLVDIDLPGLPSEGQRH